LTLDEMTEAFHKLPVQFRLPAMWSSVVTRQGLKFVISPLNL